MAPTDIFDDEKNRKLDVTKDEMEKIQEALKDKEFRKLFHEYVQEISDPKNKALYEQEIEALEQERGNNIRWIKPTPGKLLKTSYIRPPIPEDVPDDVNKVFVNLCTSPEIEKGTMTGATSKNGKKGQSWSLPYSITAGRKDIDKAGKTCMIYDCVFNPETFALSSTNPAFLNLLSVTALEGIEKQFKGVKLDRNYKVLQNLTFKGELKPTVIRSKAANSNSASQSETSSLSFIEKLASSAPLVNQTPSTKPKPQQTTSQQTATPKIKTPKYSITHSGSFTYQSFVNTRTQVSTTRPEYLILKISLPGITSAEKVDLETMEKHVDVKVEGVYELSVDLPFEVDVDNGTAKFDKGKEELSVKLPVLKGVELQMPIDAPLEVEEEEKEDKENELLTGTIDNELMEDQETPKLMEQLNISDEIQETKSFISELSSDSLKTNDVEEIIEMSHDNEGQNIESLGKECSSIMETVAQEIDLQDEKPEAIQETHVSTNSTPKLIEILDQNDVPKTLESEKLHSADVSPNSFITSSLPPELKIDDESSLPVAAEPKSMKHDVKLINSYIFEMDD